MQANDDVMIYAGVICWVNASNWQ